MTSIITASKILIASIPILISIYTKRWKELDQLNLVPDSPPELNLPTKETYDFIIVGGGTAGCVLASRLSKKFSVLVLEAGSKPPPLVNVPGLLFQIESLPDINFIFRTTPQKNVGRDKGGVLEVWAGRMLGGSGSHNGLVWERSNPHDYDRWARVTQDESWKYENIKKYFKKIERHHPPHRHSSIKGAGHIELIQSPLTHLSDIWLRAGKELGYKIRDPSETQSVGFNRIIFASQNGSRGSTYLTHLKPLMKKRVKNLTVLPYSFVSKVIIEDLRAVGVEYERHGVARAAFSVKEVIISAGSMISPIILFKSGIGPKDQVQAAKADSHIANLPVGKNLLDHPILTAPAIEVNNPKMTWNLTRNVTFKNFRDFTEKRKGPLITPFHASEVFLEFNETQKMTQRSRNWPNIQVTYHPTALVPNHVGGYIFLSRPMSRGVLTINASATGMDDNYLPLLNYNYFSHPQDLRLMAEGLHFYLRVMEETESFKKVGARLPKTPYGPCKTQKFRSDDYWKCFIQHRTKCGFHTVGTCRMGYGNGDPDAVVDSKLRVIGVKGLRVVDASIFPFIPNANIYAAVVVMAEKAADDILKAHHHRYAMGAV